MSPSRSPTSPPQRRPSRRPVRSSMASSSRATSSTSRRTFCYPEEFARRASQLRKLGVEVEVLDVKAMQKLGMGALLGVAPGLGVRPSRTVIMRWNGGKKGESPVAFIGKGVCFDTGGISIKPAGSMEDMKGDMGGAACVVGLMHALAARKAKVNVIGAIGLVENMPDGNAQRPGDIVTSMSGQTIEIINTDAEGRLVLADVLWYVAKKVKPKFMVDLATLTGAIMVALGTEYAGMFSNNDELAERLWQDGHRNRRNASGACRSVPNTTSMIDSAVRRHEEHRRAPRRLDHRSAVPAALCRRHTVGASRHRRHRHGRAEDGHQPELGFRLRRAPARPAGRRSLRTRSDRLHRMTEVLFYHLQNMTLESVLPPLLEKSLERGWRVVVQSTSPERAEALDAHLWTYQRRSLPAARDMACRRCRRTSRSCWRSRRTTRTGPMSGS